MTVAACRKFFNNLPEHFDNVHVAVSNGDPESDAFFQSEPFPPERVVVAGIGKTLAIVFGREYARPMQYRVVDPGVRTAARLDRVRSTGRHLETSPA